MPIRREGGTVQASLSGGTWGEYHPPCNRLGSVLVWVVAAGFDYPFSADGGISGIRRSVVEVHRPQVGFGGRILPKVHLRLEERMGLLIRRTATPSFSTRRRPSPELARFTPGAADMRAAPETSPAGAATMVKGREPETPE